MKGKIIAHKKPLILIVLAVVILFCLWYTRSKSWSDLTADYGSLREVNANLSIWEYDGSMNHISHHYALEVDGDTDAAAELLTLLEDNRYRLMLRSLLPLDSLEGGDYEGLEINASILVVTLSYEDTAIHLSFMGDRLSFSGLSVNGLRGYIIRDPSISDDLSRLIMDHGIQED